ncbi:MAG TPA: hypothetical protein VI316_04915 [Candidatus Dormibacteraeota bacterium]
MTALPWILFGIAAAVAVAGLIVVAVRQQRQVAHVRAHSLQQVIVAAHQLAGAAMSIPPGNEPTAVSLWWRLMEAHEATLTIDLSMLAQLPPDDRRASARAEVSGAQDALRAAVATDRSVRVGPPAPTDENLAYSAAIVRERANALRDRADALEALVLPTAVH